jgi:WD40 repeat protein
MVRFSPDLTRIASVAVTGSDPVVRIWRTADGALEHELVHEMGHVVPRSVAFSPNGSILASGTDDGKIRIWQVSTDVLLRTLDAHTGQVHDVRFLPGGTLLESRSYGGDNTVRLWRVSDGVLLATFTIEGGNAAFSPDGTLLAGQQGDACWLWEVSSGAPLHKLDNRWTEGYHFSFSPDGSFVAAAAPSGQRGPLLLYRVEDGALVHTFKEGSWRMAAFSPDGKLLAVIGIPDFAHVSLWRTEDWTLVRTLGEHTWGVIDVDFSPDGTLLATAQGERQAWIRIWGIVPQ